MPINRMNQQKQAVNQPTPVFVWIMVLLILEWIRVDNLPTHINVFFCFFGPDKQDEEK